MVHLQDASTSIHNKAGPLLVGVIVATLLYGTSCAQTLYYYSHYRRDPISIKAVVLAIWALDTIHQALICHAVYTYSIINYDLHKLIWSVLLEVVFNGLVGITVQGFFTWQIWKLSEKNVLLAAVISLLIVVELVCSVVFTVQSLKLGTWDDLTALKGLSMSVTILGVVGDVAISGTMFYLLYRSKVGLKSLESMIRRLILLTASTGFLTSICTIGSLVSILAWGQTFIYVAFYFCLGRLYSNSLLASLNVRDTIRNLENDIHDLSVELRLSLPKATSRARSSRQDCTRTSNGSQNGGKERSSLEG
ncbi:hypothetical protein BKA70DRAFT_1442805 [Coprinopsis sp. MPI-PUGE-AT-0042]|nr:hypothetical protein BKA70DRAFT_1442805 [Coprinopsis sp. MPI-PUGE-AT-0042]